MNDSNEPSADVTSLTSRLATLTTEHRDLDAVISQISSAPPPGDELLLRRLKKRKLLVKDRIAIIQRLLDPDIPA
ncbi:YdcH family protein [Zoogloea sp.]|uniref:YdcH family protein n=1 Tax=Zoogloea sp. TaxID=49181 RepID=UPI0035AE78DD